MDIQERVLSAFQQEHREHLEAMRALLSTWPEIAPAALDEIFRMAHSIKGGARVCDLGTVEKLAHYLEHLFAALQRGEAQPAQDLRGVIDEVLNSIEDYMVMVAEKRVPTEPAELLQRIGESAEPTGKAKAETPAAQPAASVPATHPPAHPRSAPSAAEMVRINAGHLDKLLQSSGSLLTESIRQTGVERELREIVASVEALQKRCEVELASEEVVRSQANAPVAALLDDLRRSLHDVSRRLRRAGALHQERTRTLRVYCEQLQNNVRQARMVPAGAVFEGFTKMVRDLAKEEGKQVEFTSSGLECEVDRLVLQALRSPVMHALRNAVSHGIEAPAERLAAGKPAQGSVRLELTVKGSQMVLRVVDDGRGLDPAMIRQWAVERGLVSVEESRALSEEEMLDFLFRPGFSTAAQVTQVSGRGMGLSVVKETAVRLQGSIRISAGQHGGSVLTIAAPLSIATHRMLLVRAAGQLFAVPSNAIVGVQRVAVSEIRNAEGRSVLMIEENPVLLATLGDVLNLGTNALPIDRGHIHVVLLRLGRRMLAVAVEEFVREQAVLVKPLPYPASASPFFSGGVIMEDGSVVLAVNVSILLEQFKGTQIKEQAEVTPVRAAPRKPSVLVVDDSFTARTLQKNILETAGYDVRVAVDGEQALSMLRANSADAVVTDVQMPRMDGFSLLEAMKQDDRLKAIPVVLVTSLSSEEDQARGLALGADAYIVKQKFDHSDLLNTIRQLM